mgnify:CR=1 FL=1
MKYILLIILPILGLCLAGCEADEAVEIDEKITIEVMDSLSVLEGDQGSKNITLRIAVNEVIADTAILFVSTEAESGNDGDYTELSSFPVIIEPGDLRVDVSIELFGDETFEEDEIIRVIYQGSNNLDIDDDQLSIIVIENDDFDTSLRIPETGYSTPTEYEGYDMIWSDEFNDAALNSTNWTHEIGGNGWGNNELQYYTDQNTYMVEGNLIIEARRESRGGRGYTSSRIITEDKFEFQYGRVDIRAVMPFGKGIWPAQWMLGANFREIGWPYCGEIDIMEMVGGEGSDNVVHGTAHWQDNGFKADFSGSLAISDGILYDEYHVYSIIWTEEKIRWYIDDIQYHEMDITGQFLSEFRAPYFFIMNVAVGGNWPGSPNSETVFPQRMIVDYIRVFQEK